MKPKLFGIAGGSLLLVAVSPVIASAHPMPGVSDFYAGMLHPVTSIESLLPLIALGLMAGQQRREAAIGMLIALPLVLVAGAAAALLLPMPSSVAWINLLWMPALGVLVAWAPGIPVNAAVAIAIGPALTIGWANGTEVGQMSALRFIPGLALSGLMLMTYATGGIRRLEAAWMRIAVRVFGSWIAAVGVLALSLR